MIINRNFSRATVAWAWLLNPPQALHLQKTWHRWFDNYVGILLRTAANKLAHCYCPVSLRNSHVRQTEAVHKEAKGLCVLCLMPHLLNITVKPSWCSLRTSLPNLSDIQATTHQHQIHSFCAQDPSVQVSGLSVEKHGFFIVKLAHRILYYWVPT
jgi:hypothetical protein